MAGETELLDTAVGTQTVGAQVVTDTVVAAAALTAQVCAAVDDRWWLVPAVAAISVALVVMLAGLAVLSGIVAGHAIRALARHRRTMRKRRESIRPGPVVVGSVLVTHRIGKRPSQEDRHAEARSDEWVVLAMFDGHGGAAAADLLSHPETGLAAAICRQLTLHCPADPGLGTAVGFDGRTGVGTVARPAIHPETVIQMAFLVADQALADAWRLESKSVGGVQEPAGDGVGSRPATAANTTNGGVGSTAVVVAVQRATGSYWVAHVGDSRAVIVRHKTVLHETRDHKPNDRAEMRRIRGTGQCVQKWGSIWRVGWAIVPRFASPKGPNAKHGKFRGGLAMSRSLGDLAFKHVADNTIVQEKSGVVAIPTVHSGQLEAGCTIVLACDGLWDVMGAREAVRFGLDAEMLADEALARGSRDNVSVMIAPIL